VGLSLRSVHLAMLGTEGTEDGQALGVEPLPRWKPCLWRGLTQLGPESLLGWHFLPGPQPPVLVPLLGT
jgi:hypothetical protein